MLSNSAKTPVGLPSIPKDIDLKKLPKHVAVIMDGNGRWATSQKLSRQEGHRAGSLALQNLMDTALALKGVQAISVYAFSTENWKRPASEVQALFELLRQFIDQKLDQIHAKKIRIMHSGSMTRLPKAVKNPITHAIEKTAKNKGMILNFCFNYGSRQEILQASEQVYQKRIKKWLAKGKTNPEDLIAQLSKQISQREFERCLYTYGLKDPDLLIRTAGEYRISNFLLWQLAYAEIHVTEKCWPDFGPADLFEAVRIYQKRTRKYGGL